LARLTQQEKGQYLVTATDKETSQSVQDVFLTHAMKNKTPVTVFLANGIRLQGVIALFDKFSILLSRDGHVQLVYKHATSTVMPVAAVHLSSEAADARETDIRH
jgi:host factor-I protein